MRGFAALLPLATAVAAVAAPASVRAEALSAGSLELEWRAPPGCPDGPAALERIRSLLASSPEAPERVTANATVAPSPTDGAWTLELSTAQGERSFQRSVRAGSCEEATEAGVLIIALAIDPDLKTPTSEPAEPAPAEPAPADVAPKPAAPSATPAPKEPAQVPRDQLDRPTASPVAFAFTASASGDIGSLPRPALGVQGALGIELMPIRAEAIVSFFPPARETLESERGGDFSLVAGGARGCYVARGDRLAVAGCGGLEIGQISGSGFGTSWRDTRASLWLAPRVGVVGSYALSTAGALRAGLEGLLPLSRPVFFLENVDRVHQPAEFVGRLEVGLELSF